ncbi:MAG: alpha/beta hydrolase [Desulfarculus sp.]|nr:alpha/beta hydrolase [Desulfarculus sp.]
MEFLDRDGVRLAYRQVGRGGPPVLFIHGYTCDHGFFDAQMEHFGASRRALAVDLRGHGQSGKPRQAYTMAGLADDCAWLCGRLGLERVVAVGHSMGGAVALELAARHPGLVAGLAALDTSILSDQRRREETLPRLVAGMAGPDYLEVHREYMSALFAPWDDPETCAAILERMARTPPWVMLSLAEEFQRWDGGAALARATCPVLVVSASQHRSQMEELRALCPWMISGQTVCSGHFITLEVPAQVNAMLERFLARGLGGLAGER